MAVFQFEQLSLDEVQKVRTFTITQDSQGTAGFIFAVSALLKLQFSGLCNVLSDLLLCS